MLVVILSFGVVILSLLCICCRGKDVSVENLNQGFTHFFESTFESVEGIAAHPAHDEYAKLLVPCLEKLVAFDYKPTIVNL